jgi:hypothetical protein
MAPEDAWTAYLDDVGNLRLGRLDERDSYLAITPTCAVSRDWIEAAACAIGAKSIGARGRGTPAAAMALSVVATGERSDALGQIRGKDGRIAVTADPADMPMAIGDLAHAFLPGMVGLDVADLSLLLKASRGPGRHFRCGGHTVAGCVEAILAMADNGLLADARVALLAYSADAGQLTVAGLDACANVLEMEQLGLETIAIGVPWRPQPEWQSPSHRIALFAWP